MSHIHAHSWRACNPMNGCACFLRPAAISHMENQEGSTVNLSSTTGLGAEVELLLFPERGQCLAHSTTTWPCCANIPQRACARTKQACGIAVSTTSSCTQRLARPITNTAHGDYNIQAPTPAKIRTSYDSANCCQEAEHKQAHMCSTDTHSFHHANTSSEHHVHNTLASMQHVPHPNTTSSQAQSHCHLSERSNYADCC